MKKIVKLDMDAFRGLKDLFKPDVRHEAFVIFDEKIGKHRRKTLEDHHAYISDINLHSGVPEDIRIHFETTKNLLLYSWYVYRFIPIAEFHAAASLEFALKEKTDGKIRGLKKLIEHAISQGWVKNEGFTNWHQKMEIKKKERKMYEELDKLRGEETEFINEEYDYIKILKDTLPAIRNFYAHGSSMVHPGGYGKLGVCAEFINQLYGEKR